MKVTMNKKKPKKQQPGPTFLNMILGDIVMICLIVIAVIGTFKLIGWMLGL